MNPSWSMSDREEEDFGPGTALVLSLFAMLLLVAAMGWRDARGAQAFLPSRVLVIGEGDAAQGYFDAGSSTLSRKAGENLAKVAGQVVADAQERRRLRVGGANHLQVIGYASPEGFANHDLAWNRAVTVRNFLVRKLHVPEECVVAASYADSHSRALQSWLRREGNSVAAFRALGTVSKQKTALGLSEEELQPERRVEVLTVYHTDSTCRLDLVRINPIP